MNIRSARPFLAVAATVSCLALAACSSSSSSSTAPAAAPTTAASSASAPASATAAASSASAAASPSAAASGSDSNIPAGLTGAALTVATNWVAFFDPSTPTAKRVSLLENGSAFSAVLAGQSSNAQGKATSAMVTAVTVSGSSADVTWNLLLSGIPMLNGQKGKAVLNNGVWQVSQSSFCGLLSLQPPVPTACKS